VIVTHDDLLRLAAETGFPGLLLFLGSVGYLTLLRSRLEDFEEAAIVGAFLVSLLFGGFLFSAPVAASFWAVLGARAGRAADARAAAPAAAG
jgi:hypothetical protein